MHKVIKGKRESTGQQQENVQQQQQQLQPVVNLQLAPGKAAFFLGIMYSLRQKHCTTALNVKSSVFLTVNPYGILYVSTYTTYQYISKVKKIAADGNPEL